MNRFDIAIIGGGPAGYVAAERAAAKGLRPILFEERELGGVCLNEGCIPTKTLLYSAKTYEGALLSQKYGITTQGVGFDYPRIVARKNKVVRKLVLGVAAKMKLHDIPVVRHHALIEGRTPEGQFRITYNDESHPDEGISERRTCTSDNLLVCTGAEAFIPPIPGLHDARTQNAAILTNREILALKELPESLVVVGGGVVGMEFASFFNSLGTRVTVIEQMPEILGANDLEISGLLRSIYTKKGIVFHLSCKVTRISTSSAEFDPEAETSARQPSSPATTASNNAPITGETATVHFTDMDDHSHEITAEKVLISAGRKPVTEGFGLETLGVKLNERGGIATDERMRTNIPGVYAAGDVTGISMLAHTASREAEVAVNDICASIYATSNGATTSVGSAFASSDRDGTEGKALRAPANSDLAAGSNSPEQSQGRASVPYASDRVPGLDIPATTHVGMPVPDTMSYKAVPGVVYTNPEVASVGLTYEAARAQGLSVRELSLPLAYSGRFVAENEGGEGLCKVVVTDYASFSGGNSVGASSPNPPAETSPEAGKNPSVTSPEVGRVVGVHILGNPASEMIWGASLAIERGATVNDLRRIIFPHPSVSEIIKETMFL